MDQQDWQERAEAAAGVLTGRWGEHQLAVVLGSGWADALDELGDPHGRSVELATLPGFSRPTVAGHGSAVHSLMVDGVRVLAFAGRTHYYESRDAFAVAHGVRVAMAAGCRVVVLTNAAGAITPRLAVGDCVVVTDHVNLTFASPFTTPPAVRDGRVYHPGLVSVVRAECPELASGVYGQFIGPQYESAAEIAMAASFGVDLAGMSTAIEALAVHGAGRHVLALSLVTNAAAGVSAEPLDHRQVLEVGAKSARSALAVLNRTAAALMNAV